MYHCFFHFSFDHCIVCDLQLLMYHCSFSFFIWPLYCLWFTAIRSCKSQTMQWSSEKWKRTLIHQKLYITDNSMVKWKMKKNNDTSEAVNHQKCKSVTYSFWCIIVLFHFSFDHCIVYDLQLLVYHCSFSVFIWPLHCLWFTASDVSVFFKRTMIHQKL
jgi:hypothetical protein